MNINNKEMTIADFADFEINDNDFQENYTENYQDEEKEILVVEKKKTTTNKLKTSKMSNNTANIKKTLIKKYKACGSNISHTFLDGGKLFIPQEELKEVYESLSQNKVNPPLTERITAYNSNFKFFIDVDDEAVNLDKLIEISNRYTNPFS